MARPRNGKQELEAGQKWHYQDTLSLTLPTVGGHRHSHPRAGLQGSTAGWCTACESGCKPDLSEHHRPSGGFSAGKGRFGSSLPAGNDPADLKMNSAISVRGRRCFACLWWQTLGLVRWDFSILSPILLLCFQPEVPACSTLLEPSSCPRQKGCYSNNNSVTSPDQCHPSLQENRGRKALKELQKNSVSGVGMNKSNSITLHSKPHLIKSFRTKDWKQGQFAKLFSRCTVMAGQQLSKITTVI